MRFRSRMILAYATVALLISLGLGIIIGKNSLRYEQESQKNNLLVSVRSYVAQMDENLGRMDAIMSYILSDASMLDGITTLAKQDRDNGEGSVPNRYILDARSTVSVGLTTEYIMKNSYRTVFFNQNSFLASSAIYTPDADNAPSQRLNTDFRVEDIPYLAPVIEGDGKSVIVAGHADFWGAYEQAPVYSLMKALRGSGMGFLEVENRIDDLALLEKSDPDIRFLILVNGEELLYASEDNYGERLSDSDRRMLDYLEEEVVSELSGDIYVKASSDNFDLTILAYKPEALMRAGRRRIFMIAFFAALSVFGVSLVMIIFWSDILTRPVKQLQEVVEGTNIENLQDSQRLDGTSGPDEFQELIRSYQGMTARLDNALKNEKRAAMLQLQAQFDTLQTQVNPHFIYNVLNIISSYAVIDNNEVICEMCGSLGNMLRYSTNNKERYASVEKELEYLNSYFYLLKARYENRLEVSIEMDGPTGKQIIPKLTLQQFVENCIKHGFRNKNDCMHISLTGRTADDRWTITVQDNGHGIEAQTLAGMRQRLEEIRKDILERAAPTEMEIGGMGVANTYARCLLLYREDLIFELDNVPNDSGFAVTVGQKIRPDAGKEKLTKNETGMKEIHYEN